MSHYAKFMKDIISKKRKVDKAGVVSLSAYCSAIIQKNMPQKMQDLTSINMMPLSMVKMLSLGELTPTTMSLQMAERSIAQPKGIL